MKSKFKIFLMLAVFSLIIIGCNTKPNIKELVSEITKVYFVGENEDLRASVSVGEREENYIIDGKHTKNCDFSLINMNLPNHFEDELEISISINGVMQNIVLYYNPVNSYYMNDLGWALKADDQINIIFDNKQILLENVSKNFEVNYIDAMDIAIDKLSDKIQPLYDKNVFNGECYLKILNKNFDNKDLYWCFSIESTKGETTTILISTQDGNNYYIS